MIKIVFYSNNYKKKSFKYFFFYSITHLLKYLFISKVFPSTVDCIIVNNL